MRRNSNRLRENVALGPRLSWRFFSADQQKRGPAHQHCRTTSRLVDFDGFDLEIGVLVIGRIEDCIHTGARTPCRRPCLLIASPVPALVVGHVRGRKGTAEARKPTRVMLMTIRCGLKNLRMSHVLLVHRARGFGQLPLFGFPCWMSFGIALRGKNQIAISSAPKYVLLFVSDPASSRSLCTDAKTPPPCALRADPKEGAVSSMPQPTL